MLRTEYEAYIASAGWARKRLARLALDGHQCRMCDEDGTRYQLEVHHRPTSYKRIPNESVQDDLITVCARCHELITAAIRGDRYAKRALPTVEVITENINVRMEIDHGVARNSVQISIISSIDPAQRENGQPARQVGKVDQTDFVETQQNRR
jgi:hypothetical protein